MQPFNPVILITSILIVSWVPCCADDADVRFLDKLLASGRYSLAEAHCRDRLRASKDVTDRATWTMGWMRVHMDHARQLPPPQRTSHWHAIEDLAVEFRRQHPQTGYRLLVDFQVALANKSRAELLVLESAIGSLQVPDEEAVRNQLRTTIGLFTTLLEQIEQQLRIKEGSSTPQAMRRLSAARLRGLRASIRHSIAQLFMFQAERYAANSPDRLSACQSALKELSRLSPSDMTSTTWWQSRIDKIACLRLQHSWAACVHATKSLASVRLSTEFVLRLLAERIQLQLEQGNLDEALSLVSQGRQIDDKTSPELDVAHLSTYLAHWSRARKQRDAASSQAWQKKTKSCLKRIERDHQPYWSRRGEILLADFGFADDTQVDGDLLALKAKSALLRGELQEAIRVYELAAQQAGERGERRRAFDYSLKAAAITHRESQHAEAAKRFSQVAASFRQHELAAQAQWLAITNQAQLVRADVRNVTVYRTLLEDYVKFWPTGQRVGEVRQWLAKLYENEAEWFSAAQQLVLVNSTSDSFAQSIIRAEQLFSQHFAEQPPSPDEVRLAVSAFRRQVDEDANKWSLGSLWSILAACRLQMRWYPKDIDSVVKLLDQAYLLPLAEEYPEWKVAATATKIVFAASRQDWTKATSLVSQVAKAPVEDQFDLMASIRLDSSLSRSARAAQSDLQLQLLSQLLLQELRPEERTRAERWRARSLVQNGNREQALAAYQRITQANAADGDMQEEYARLLGGCSQRSLLLRAVQQWRLVISKSQSGSPRWFRAKLGVAQAHYDLNDPQRAAQIIRLVLELHPELDEELAQQFRMLLTRCLNK